MNVQTRSHLSGEPSPQADDSQADRIARAEALLRTIVGIADVRVVPHPAGGIAVVRVDCGDEATPGQVMRNIRSALFAGLGISISPECVDFVLPNELEGTSSTATASGTASVSGDVGPAIVHAIAPTPAVSATRILAPAAKAPAIEVARPSQRPVVPAESVRAPLRPAALYDGPDQAQRPAAAAQHAVIGWAAHAVETSSDAALRRAVTVTTEAPGSTETERTAIGRSVRDIVASAAALKLESVELRRQSGRLRCRVVVSLGTDHFGAVADSSDPHAVEINLTGRVTCDALRAGGFTEARFDGATIAQINGREHVVVALSEWMGGETMVLSGAAPLEDTHERAAAIAAIKAVLAQDIS